MAVSGTGIRVLLAVMLLGGPLAGCGTSSGRTASSAAARTSQCVDRLVSRSATSGLDEQQRRRYAEDTYCAPFERQGWVYEDGALSIAAQQWLDNAGAEECAAGSAGEPPKTVPCEQLDRPSTPRTIDCALLHHVRRTEAVAYLAELQRGGAIRCDDRTPLGELGVP